MIRISLQLQDAESFSATNPDWQCAISGTALEYGIPSLEWPILPVLSPFSTSGVRPNF